MPFRRRYARRPYRRRRLYNNKRFKRKARGGKLRIVRPLTMGGIYNFTRTATPQVITLSNTSVPTGWTLGTNNELGRSWAFQFSDIDNYQEFRSLFKYWRINAVGIKMYFSQTISGITNSNAYSNSQILCYYDANLNGLASPAATNTYTESQTSKKKLCLNTIGKPLNLYCKVKQAGLVYGGGTLPAPLIDYTVNRPKWISMTEVTAQHYGFNTCLVRTDNQPFSTGTDNDQSVRIEIKYFFQCRKVQ